MAKCRVFAIDSNLKEVVANGLYMKHMFGETISVAVVKFVKEQGINLPAKSHSHGEEASLQFVGACSVYEGQGSSNDWETSMDAGDGLLIPANLEHYGANRFGPEGVSMRLNVVTPARREYGAEDTVPYYPLADRGDGK
ncbi:cupin domain-containing protein [Cupriavidus pinatubonensis]|uniref:Cupin 2 conserved barrel domain-containing protein n=1 Tax=Cupriavidus pinatubonensis TaxID=248026 RepID=A0ABN7ZNQ9_9BURK|nr:cupin [Cupriavidus pinatubonensis]CAG9187573.1 hypothetical protein LMG23994_07018 [Cupriavidus pinatubonensis]